MPEFDALVTRTATDSESANVLHPRRPLFVIRDIPGPDGIPLMNTPWQLKLGETEVASGVTDKNGRVVVLAPLTPGEVYVLEYPGRSVEIEATELAAIGGTKGMQQRLFGLGYAPGPDDGNAGPLTESALMEFQEDHGLVVDGVYGAQSQQKLLEVYGQ